MRPFNPTLRAALETEGVSEDESPLRTEGTQHIRLPHVLTWRPTWGATEGEVTKGQTDGKWTRRWMNEQTHERTDRCVALFWVLPIFYF